MSLARTSCIRTSASLRIHFASVPRCCHALVVCSHRNIPRKCICCDHFCTHSSSLCIAVSECACALSVYVVRVVCLQSYSLRAALLYCHSDRIIHLHYCDHFCTLTCSVTVPVYVHVFAIVRACGCVACACMLCR